MTILTKESAKTLALQTFNNLKSDFQKDFYPIHSYKVGKIAKILANKLNIFDDVFEIAGRTHDIGYSKEEENHAVYSLDILRQRGYEIDEILEDCILNHGNGKMPTTTQGRIFQLADKLSIFDEQILEVLLKNSDFPYEDDAIHFLKNMSEKTFLMLETFTAK